MQIPKMFCTTEIALARMIDLIGPLKKKKRKTNHYCPSIDPREETSLIPKVILPDILPDWGQDCPDRSNQTNNTWLSHETVLFQADFDNPNELKGLLDQSWNTAVLDSDASKTVCG